MRVKTMAKLAAKSPAVHGATLDLSTLDDGWWDYFQYGAWAFLWSQRDKLLWEFKVWKLPLKRIRWKDLRHVWSTPFGPCPFDWNRGPVPSVL